jgi:protein phosphatase
MRRTNNQDSCAAIPAKNGEVWQQRGHMFMVADGMGAHAVGELASKLACDNIPHHYKKTKSAEPAEALVKAYREVGALIHSKATANKDFHGMGTTCSTLVLLPAGVLIAHVGDSRVYRIRNARIEQLTFDHSLVWELVRHKHLKLESAQKAVPRNVITRSLGPDPVVEVDLEGPYQVEPGDVFLLCSDGLSGLVDDPELGVFASSCHPEAACRYLTQLANLRGGQDNITTLIVRVGPWEGAPGEAGGAAAPGAGTGAAAGRGGFRLGSLLSGFRGKAARPVEVEEHIYQASDCTLDEAAVARIGEDVRQSSSVAVDQSWPVDWQVLANLRRESEEARKEGDLRGALRCLGEAVALLGQAGRLYRKEQASSASN